VHCNNAPNPRGARDVPQVCCSSRAETLGLPVHHPESPAAAALYSAHLATLMQRADEALRRAGKQHLLIPSGVTKYHFLDDRPYPFQVNPHFKAWLPLTEYPDCWLIITPGQTPHLIYLLNDDFWHLPPRAPEGYWIDHWRISLIRSPDDARALLPPAIDCAIVGEADAALQSYVPDNSPALLDYLHYHRASKTAYELALLREASARAVRGHRAAEASFRAGGSELDIHRAYLAATAHNDLDLPYTNIVCLNEHCATLHYQYQSPLKPAEFRSMLIDAGASVAGYAADITRTWSNGDRLFDALIQGVDAAQRALVEGVREGVDYRHLHVECHHRLADVLRDVGVLKGSAEAAVAEGISAAFFPHGLGHLLGLQVHDVAGFAASDAGGHIERPEGHPFLRLTRPISAGMVMTIEPGIYFIESLLAPLRERLPSQRIDWALIERLKPFGGVRIEDDVVCTHGLPENLTRDAFAAA
jgi:Xaa-Pro dipeptidase